MNGRSHSASRRLRAALCGALAIAGSLVGAATPDQRGQAAVIRAITAAPRGGEAVVTIDADGPLPTPSVGVVDGPPRIYLDFTGVTTKAASVTRSSDPRIRRVRISLHTENPLVTRVVVDLVNQQPYRLEQGPGRVMILVGTPLATPRPPRAQAAVIRGISTASRGGEAVVTIDADGPLPSPSVGVVDGPPRIYLDFTGVRPKPAGVTRSSDPRIRRARVGLHSTQPLVTRVVVDLVSQQPYRIEQAPGRVTVIVGAAPTGGAPVPHPALSPVPPLPEPPPPIAPPVRVPREAPAPASRPSSPPVATLDKPPSPTPSLPASSRPSSDARARALPTKDLYAYRRQVSAALDRLRLQQPLLASIDGLERQTPERLQMAVAEFERLKQELTGMKPAQVLRAQHDLLIQSATLGLMATRMRLSAFPLEDIAMLRNAASAAAGAILLLDRACADLGCPEPVR